MSVSFLDRAVSGVHALRPYEPGKPVEELQRELGLSDVIKLASNENPLGPGPRALAALRDATPGFAAYPDGTGFRLKHKLADHLDIDPARIALGNGSNDVIDLLARVFLGPGRAAIFSEYAFAIYALVVRAVGAEAKVAAARPRDDAMSLGHDLDRFRELLDESVRLIYIANPNNPTGTWLAPDALVAFLDAVPEDVVVVLDEAYREYMDPALLVPSRHLLDRHPNLVVTRTFSKIHGLAGLRIGYALGDANVINLVNRVRQPFNANSFAMVAAEAALDDAEHVARSASLNRTGREWLRAALTERGLATLPSQANFITVDVGRPASVVFDGLLREGVIVRPLGGYGLPQSLRVTVGTEPQNQRFIAALQRVLDGG